MISDRVVEDLISSGSIGPYWANIDYFVALRLLANHHRDEVRETALAALGEIGENFAKIEAQKIIDQKDAL